MLERVLEQLLIRFLAPYVDGISKDKLRLGLLHGCLTFHDLRVKTDALRSLGLKVKSGNVGLLKILVPWQRIYSGKVVVDVKDVHFQVEKLADDGMSEDEIINRMREAKEEAIKVHVEQLRNLVEKENERLERDQSGSNVRTTSNKLGFGAKLVRKIINNINISIDKTSASYMHASNGGLACGVKLQKLDVLSTNQQFHEAPEPTNEVVVTDGSLYKLVRLERLRIVMADVGNSSLEGAGYVLHPVSAQLELSHEPSKGKLLASFKAANKELLELTFLRSQIKHVRRVLAERRRENERLQGLMVSPADREKILKDQEECISQYKMLCEKRVKCKFNPDTQEPLEEEEANRLQQLQDVLPVRLLARTQLHVVETIEEEQRQQDEIARASRTPKPGKARGLKLAGLKQRLGSLRETWRDTRSFRDVWFELSRPLPNEELNAESSHGDTLLKVEERRRLLHDFRDESKFPNAEVPQTMKFQFELGMLAVDLVDDRWSCERERQLLSLALEQAQAEVSIHFTPILKVQDSVDWNLDVRLSTFHAMHATQSVFEFCPFQPHAGILPYKQRSEGSALKLQRSVSRLGWGEAARLAVASKSGEEENIMTLLFDFAPTEINLPQGLVAEIRDFWRVPELSHPPEKESEELELEPALGSAAVTTRPQTPSSTIPLGEIIHQQVGKAVSKAVKNKALAETVVDKVYKQIPDKLVLRVKIASPTFHVPVPGQGTTAFSLGLFQIATEHPCKYSDLRLACELDDMVLWATTIRGERFDIFQPVLINVTVHYESTDQGNSVNICADVERPAELSLKLTPQALQMLMATPFAVSGAMSSKDRTQKPETPRLAEGEVVQMPTQDAVAEAPEQGTVTEQVDISRDDLQDAVVEVNREAQREPKPRPFQFNMLMNFHALDVTLVDSVVPVIVIRMQWLPPGLHICREGTLNIELRFTLELLILNPRNNALEQLVERFHGAFALSRHTIGEEKDTRIVINGHEELLLNLKPTLLQRITWFVPRLLKGLTFDRDLVITSSDGKTSDVSKYRVVNLCGQALQLEFKSCHRSGLIKQVEPTGSRWELLDNLVLAPNFATAVVVALPGALSSSEPLSLENNGAVAIPSGSNSNDGSMQIIAELLTPSPSDRMQHRMVLLSSPIKMHNTTDLTLMVRFHAAEGDHSRVLRITSNWSRCCDAGLLGYFSPEGLGPQSGACMGNSHSGGCNEDDEVGEPVMLLSPNTLAAVPSDAISIPEDGVWRVWLSFRPVGPGHAFCDVTEAGADVDDQILQCKGNRNSASMHLVCRSTTPPGPVSQTTIVLQAPVVILNALPICNLVVDYGLLATSETRERGPALFRQEATVPGRCRQSLYDFPGILWRGGISIRARLGSASPWSSTLHLAPMDFADESRPVGTLELRQWQTGAAAGVMVEQLDRRELRFSCPYWFVDRSGVPKGLSLGLKFRGGALPRDSGITLLPATCLEEECELVVAGAAVLPAACGGFFPGGCCSMGALRRATFRMPPNWSVVTVPQSSVGSLVFCVQADDVASSDVLGAECQVMTLRPRLIFTNSSACNIELQLAGDQQMILEAGVSHEHHWEPDGGNEGLPWTTLRFRPCCETPCDWSGMVNCSDVNAGSTPFLLLATSREVPTRFDRSSLARHNRTHVWSVEVAPSRGSLAVSFRQGSDFVAANRTSLCKARISIEPLSSSSESKSITVPPGSEVPYGWADPTPERRAVNLVFATSKHTKRYKIEDVRRTMRRPVRHSVRYSLEIDVIVAVSRKGTQTLLTIEDRSAAREHGQQSGSSTSKSCLRVEVKLRSVGISLIEEISFVPFARELLFVHLELIRLEWQKQSEKDEQQLRLMIYDMQVDCQLPGRLGDHRFNESGFLEQVRPAVILANGAKGDQPFLNLFIQRGATSSRDMVLPKIEFELDDLDITFDDGWVDPLVSFAKQSRSQSTGGDTSFLAIQEMAGKPFTQGYMFPPMPSIIQVESLKIKGVKLTLWCAIKLRSARVLPPYVRTAFKVLSFSDELTLEGAKLDLPDKKVALHRGSLMDFSRGLANEYMLDLMKGVGHALGRCNLLNLPRVPMKIGGDAVAWMADGVGTVAGEAASLLEKATFDDEYVSKRQKKKDEKEIKGFTAGMAEAVTDLGAGLEEIKDIWKKPEEGFHTGGIQGAAVGLGHGLWGGVLKPTAGFGRAIADLAAGLGATAAETIKKNRRGRQRLRQPRLLYSGGAAIRTWCELDAELLRQLGTKRLFGVEEIVCLEQREQKHTVLLLFKDRFLLVEMHAAGSRKDQSASSMDILGAVDETAMKLFKPLNNFASSVKHLQKQWKGEEPTEEEEMPEGCKCLSMDLCLLRNADIDHDDVGPLLMLTKGGANTPIILPLYRGHISAAVQEGLLAGFISAVEHPDRGANWDNLHQALRSEERSRQECAQQESFLLEAGKKTLEVFEVERWRLALGIWTTPFLPIDNELCWRWVDATGRKHPHLQQNLNREVSAAKREHPPCELDALFEAQDNWEVEKGQTTDPEGWCYGLAWRSSTWENSAGMFDVLRKRKWRRTYA